MARAFPKTTRYAVPSWDQIKERSLTERGWNEVQDQITRYRRGDRIFATREEAAAFIIQRAADNVHCQAEAKRRAEVQYRKVLKKFGAEARRG